MRVTRSIGLGLVVLLAAIPGKVKAQGPQGAQGPKGWVGLVITTGIGTMGESGAMSFTDYPTIESIDPGSPAERAGLQSGDVLISINAQDFKKNPIPMGSLLVPGQKIVFRFKRNDIAKVASLTVIERPIEAKAYVQFQLIEPVPAQGGVRERARTEALLNRNVALGAPRGPLVSIAPLVIGSGSPTLRFLGAELTQMSDDLRERLQVRGDGVFVIKVAMGTPAGEAGLKGGDVIVKAANEPIQNPGELIRLIRSASENFLMLRILRGPKAQELTLRW